MHSRECHIWDGLMSAEANYATFATQMYNLRLPGHHSPIVVERGGRVPLPAVVPAQLPEIAEGVVI